MARGIKGILYALLALAALGRQPALSEEDWSKFMEDRPKAKEFLQNETRPRVEEQKNVYDGHYPLVESLVNEKFPKEMPDPIANPNRSPIDEGWNNPAAFHGMDAQRIADVFEQCMDRKEVQALGSCLCLKRFGPAWIPDLQPPNEYWWPVSKVENVDKPLKTGYLTPERVKDMRKNTEQRWIDNGKIKEWSDAAGNRMHDKTRAYLAARGVEIKEAGERQEGGPDPMEIRNVNPDANWRRLTPEGGGYRYNDFHAMVEPYGRDKAYWEDGYSQTACHWNLPAYEQSDNGEVSLGTSFFSEESEVGFEQTRNAEMANLMLAGRDKKRMGLGYDHPKSAWADLSSHFYTEGRWISKYVENQISANNPFECTEKYLAGQGRTPEDMLKPFWGPDPDGDMRDVGCKPQNMGHWVPTHAHAQTLYHTTAALVGSMRGLKLGYWNLPPDGNCIGVKLLDSWGWYFDDALFRVLLGIPGSLQLYCYNPYQHLGTFYDFEPDPYTIAFAQHTFDPASGSESSGGGGLVPDQVLPTFSTEMPKQCISLIKYFSDLERGGWPNKQELDSENPTGKPIDPHNVLVQWRFFRTCPKQLNEPGLVEELQARGLLVEGHGKYIGYSGTRSAYCCQPLGAIMGLMKKL